MSTTTPYQGWVIPSLGDLTPVRDNIFSWIDDADQCMFPRFADNSTRDTRITSPEAGMVCYSAEFDEFYKYSQQGEWVSFFPRRVFNTSNITLPDTNPVTYATVSLESHSIYFFQGLIEHSGLSPADDLKIHFTFSNAVVEGWYGIPQTGDFTAVQMDGYADVGSPIGSAGTIVVETSSGEILELYGGFVVTNLATTMTISFSKNADTAGDGTIYGYRTIFDFWKVDGSGGTFS